MGLFHVAGQTVEDDGKRTFIVSIGNFQFGMQADMIAVDKEFFHVLSPEAIISFRRK